MYFSFKAATLSSVHGTKPLFMPDMRPTLAEYHKKYRGNLPKGPAKKKKIGNEEEDALAVERQEAEFRQHRRIQSAHPAHFGMMEELVQDYGVEEVGGGTP